MSDMLTRASHAVEDALASDANHPDDIARAVLVAVREADEVVRQRASEIYASEPTPVFTAMIDAILSEAP